MAAVTRDDVVQGGPHQVSPSPLEPKSPTSPSSPGSNTNRLSFPLPRKPVGSSHPLPPVPPEEDNSQPGSGQISSRQSSGSFNFNLHSRSVSREIETPEPAGERDSGTVPVTREIPIHQRQVENGPGYRRHSHAAQIALSGEVENGRDDELSSYESTLQEPEETAPQLQYFHRPFDSKASPISRHHVQSPSTSSHSSDQGSGSNRGDFLNPHSRSGHYSDRGRNSVSPHLSVHDSPGGSPMNYARSVSTSRRSPDNRPTSYVDLLNVPYSQQIAPSSNLGNNLLKNAVGTNASLLDSKKTIEMYRANLKKTTEPSVAYEFAVFMVGMAQTIMAEPQGASTHGIDPTELLKEARIALQRLADRSFPFAQYYLADGYASGLFSKGKDDYGTAFPLFIAASKHGHAEAGYRAALCYEFGWGCRKDYPKAVQYYRTSASKAHPGAATRLGKACLTRDLGLLDNYREGLKWLKRGVDYADVQYNSAPYELGLLHETGYGPDCFKDETYAAQLFTQSADLGHGEANFKMGEAYEHGLLQCPKDPALSVHFYNGAAQAGIPEAMMSLCAWYMVGAEPIMDKDENEAYEWAKRAAELGLPKAEYALGYFTEMGIGCRRDPLEANVWYVKAAGQGDERAKQRLAIIQAAASGESGLPQASAKGVKGSPKGKDGKEKDKDCIVM